MQIFNKIKVYINKHKQSIRFNKKILIAFFVGVLLIASTYAWFYASLNVKINFFKMTTSSEMGLFISLDGIEFGSEINISKDDIINNLNNYPNHTNQWPSGGLFTVSTNGIANNNTYQFNIFESSKVDFKSIYELNKKYLSTKKVIETEKNENSNYIAFDIFLKNVSGSPYSDNLYLLPSTSLDFVNKDEALEDEKNEGILNSIRLGMSKGTTANNKADGTTVQNLPCNNNCQSMIYEPYSVKHSVLSIERAKKYKVNLMDGVYTPTYGVIKEGAILEMENGLNPSNVPLDSEHFALQNTIKNVNDSIFELPNGITKFRVYIWLEGQDIDSLQTGSSGSTLRINIDFYKDLAGYEE